jgi:hypothetical protein
LADFKLNGTSFFYDAITGRRVLLINGKANSSPKDIRGYAKKAAGSLQGLKILNCHFLLSQSLAENFADSVGYFEAAFIEQNNVPKCCMRPQEPKEGADPRTTRNEITVEAY